jgi:hypothetical protein
VYLPVGAVTESAAGTGNVVSALDASKIKIKTTKETAAKATKDNLTCALGTLTVSEGTETWENTAATAATHIKVTYNPTDENDTTTGTADDVVFYIELDDYWKDNWTYVADATDPVNQGDEIGTAIGHFYLKDDLEAGATSPKLINSVTMSNKVTQQAFVDLTYDINVVLDSVQITFDEDDYELMPGGTKANNVAKPWTGGATGTAALTDHEISSIAWSND